MNYRFCVVVKVPMPPDPMNLALGGFDTYLEKRQPDFTDPDDRGDYVRVVDLLPGQAAILMRVPVFAKGELMVMVGDREAAGRGRNPGKWGIDVEWFDDLDAAVARARDVQA